MYIVTKIWEISKFPIEISKGFVVVVCTVAKFIACQFSCSHDNYNPA
jgi:hypothetical protein